MTTVTSGNAQAEELVATLGRARDNANRLMVKAAQAQESGRAYPTNLVMYLVIDKAAQLLEDLDRGGGMDRLLEEARDFERILSPDYPCNLDMARGLDPSDAGNVAFLLRQGGIKASRLIIALDEDGRPREAPVEESVPWAARRLVALTVRILPGPHRRRYAEEFDAELRDQASGSRLGYGMRLLASAVKLRWALTQCGGS
jgi:hypothetical protein